MTSMTSFCYSSVIWKVLDHFFRSSTVSKHWIYSSSHHISHSSWCFYSVNGTQEGNFQQSHQALMCFFFLFQVHMQVIFSSDRGMKRVSLHNEAQVVPQCNYRNPVSRETSSTIVGFVSCMLLYSFLCKERLEAVLQVIYLTRAFHKDQKMNKQRAGEGNPTLKRFICKTNMAHVRKSCIIQATETLSAILGFLSVCAFACDYLWSNQNSEIAPKQSETKHSAI